MTEHAPSHHLPKEAREMLIAAAKNGGGQEVDKAVEKIKRKYPKFYRQEKTHESETE